MIVAASISLGLIPRRLRRKKEGSPRNTPPLGAGMVYFQGTSPSENDYHNASRLQYVVHLAGISEIEVADGTVKRLHPGDVLIAQDTTGHGHITRGIGEESRVSLAVPLDKGHWFPGGP